MQDEAECLQTCIIQQFINKYQKIPASGIIKDYTDHVLVLSANHPEDFQQIQNNCKKRCNKPACHQVMTFTKTTSIWFDIFIIVITVSDDPDISMESAPAFTLVEFLSYLMGSLGAWTGLSFLSLDPKSVYSMTLGKRKSLSYRKMQATADCLFQRLYDLRVKLSFIV
jgi:hypothetical protein